jgi:hypothetical protein
MHLAHCAAAPAMLALAATDIGVAQPAREKLDGFQEMRFGTSLDEARKTLAKAKADSKTSRDGRTLQMLTVDLTFERQAFGAAYIFGTGNRLALVRLVPDELIMTTNAAACTGWGKKIGAAMTKKYGPPDTTRGGIGNTSTVYRFRDGNEITVAADPLPGGCLAAIQYVTPEARDGKY